MRCNSPLCPALSCLLPSSLLPLAPMCALTLLSQLQHCNNASPAWRYEQGGGGVWEVAATLPAWEAGTWTFQKGLSRRCRVGSTHWAPETVKRAVDACNHVVLRNVLHLTSAHGGADLVGVAGGAKPSVLVAITACVSPQRTVPKICVSSSAPSTHLRFPNYEGFGGRAERPPYYSANDVSPVCVQAGRRAAGARRKRFASFVFPRCFCTRSFGSKLAHNPFFPLADLQVLGRSRQLGCSPPPLVAAALRRTCRLRIAALTGNGARAAVSFDPDTYEEDSDDEDDYGEGIPLPGATSAPWQAGSRAAGHTEAASSSDAGPSETRVGAPRPRSSASLPLCIAHTLRRN